jgi:hypothetical protein
MSGRHRGRRTRQVLLTLLANGGAELNLNDENGPLLWASDSDEDFLEEMAGQEFLDENDIPEVLEYLVDEGYLTDAEADAAEIDIETLEAEGEPETIDVEPEQVESRT